MNYDTHLCLISAQATPNLLPALDEHWRPRRVVLATSRDMADRAGYLEPRGMLIDYRGMLSGSSGKSDRKRVDANMARAKAAGIRIVSANAIKSLKNEITQWIA